MRASASHPEIPEHGYHGRSSLGRCREGTVIMCMYISLITFIAKLAIFLYFISFHIWLQVMCASSKSPTKKTMAIQSLVERFGMKETSITSPRAGNS